MSNTKFLGWTLIVALVILDGDGVHSKCHGKFKHLHKNKGLEKRVIPGVTEVIGVLTGVASVVSAGVGVITNIQTGVETASQIVPGFLRGVLEGVETFRDIIKFGHNISQLIGIDLKNHAILVDNPKDLPVSIRCTINSVPDRYQTAWFDLEEELGFVLKFRTVAPTWIQGIGTIQCEFRHDHTNQKAGPGYVYGGNSYGKEELSYFMIIDKPTPRVYRMTQALDRIDGRTPQMVFQ